MNSYESQYTILPILNSHQSNRINLPTLESEFRLTLPVFWIDEKTKDYLVLGTAVSFKKGDNSWKQIPKSLLDIEKSINMVYKDHKLYYLNYCYLKVFDFSGEILLKVLEVSVRCVHRFWRTPGRMPPNIPSTRMKTNVVVTLNGDVLIVKSIRRGMSKIWEFKVYKMDSSKGNNEWEKIESLGDEAILLELGITVLAKDIKGIKKNSIYFSGYKKDIFVYSLDRKNVEKPHQFVSFPFDSLMLVGSYQVSNEND